MSEHGHQNHGGHSVQAGSGGDSQSLSQILGLEQHGHGHNFISHLLGLDHDHGHHVAHGHVQHGVQHGPSHGVTWNSALKALNITNALQGINVSANFLFLLLFIGFFAWLFVIYFIRHHEPLANHVIGSGAAQSATASADRQLVEGIKNAMPMHTRADFGEVYVPNKPTAPVPGPSGLVYAGPSSEAQPVLQPALQFSTFAGSPAPVCPSYQGQASGYPSPVAAPASAGCAGSFQGQGAYVVPNGNAGAARVKTIVNR